MLLFPCDPFRPRRVDDHFAPEAEAARDLGIPYALIDHDAVPRDPARAVRGVPESTAVYRGWMLRSADYAAFERALSARGTTLRTTTDQYRTAHELPGWHAALAPLTPLVRALALPFVTVDPARHADGRLRVVELGDAQVSDRPGTTPPEQLVKLLAQ